MKFAPKLQASHASAGNPPQAWMLAFLLVAGFGALLIFAIRLMHMHPDEQLAYFFTRRDLPFLWWYLRTQDTHPPLWFSSFWVMRHLFGDSEFVARFYSALLSMLTLSLVYQLGRRWFGAPRDGWFIVMVLGVNAFFVYHALEMRPYALIMLLATVSMWALQRWLARRTWRRAFTYAVTVAAMLYVHYFLGVLIMVQAACYIITSVRAYPAVSLRQWVGQGMGVMASTFILWLPWLPAAFNQVANLRRAELIGGNERGVIGAGTTTVPTSLEAVLELAQMATNGLLWLYFPILILGMVLLWRRTNYRLALAWAVGAPALSFMLNTVAAIYTPRYVLYMVVGVAVVIGAALAAIPLRRIGWLLLLGLMGVSLWVLPGQFPNRTPYRDLYRKVNAAVQPGDVIFFDHADTESRFTVWQIREYLNRSLWRTRLDRVEDTLEYPRVWFVTEDWFDPEVQANFRAIESTHPLQLVIGDCTSDWCYLIQLLETAPTQP